MQSSSKPPRVLAVASSGGHWIQLLRLRPAFEGCDVAFACTEAGNAGDVEGHRFYRIPDATRWNKLRLVALALRMLWVLARERPHVVLSTGAAPGFLALRMAGFLGSRTLWIDSIANSEEMSMSGRLIRGHADLCLTQWEHLSQPEGPHYRGAVL